MAQDIVVLGIFAADTAYRAERMPAVGETVAGRDFALNAGGKGSNQAVAAARAGGSVALLTKIGRDTFAALADETWDEAGVTFAGTRVADAPTGAAFIFVDDATGDNAIIVTPGAAGTISPADVEGWGETIRGARVLVTQLEQPLAAAHRALAVARESGVRTILNPAPATELDDAMLALCDVITPNGIEAAQLTGIAVDGPESAGEAARALVARGAGAAVVTLGAEGAVLHDGTETRHVAGRIAGEVVDTTGAGDAFNGTLALALSEGWDLSRALDFANAAGALSVTRPGAAPSMPHRAEITALLG